MLRSINLLLAAITVATTAASVSTAQARDGGTDRLPQIIFTEDGPKELVLPTCRRCRDIREQEAESPAPHEFFPKWNREPAERFRIRIEVNPAYSR